MNRIFTISSISLMLLSLNFYANATQSGIHLGGELSYANSRIPTIYTFDDGLLTKENRDYAVAGALPGVSLGYRLSVSEKLYLDASASISANFSDIERTTGTNGATTVKLILNRMISPMITVGVTPNNETSLGIKVGYRQQNWTEQLITTTPIDIKLDNNSDGWVIGGEVMTAVFNKKLLIGLSATHSRIDEFLAITDTTGGETRKLYVEPQTTVVSAVFQFFPQNQEG